MKTTFGEGLNGRESGSGNARKGNFIRQSGPPNSRCLPTSIWDQIIRNSTNEKSRLTGFAAIFKIFHLHGILIKALHISIMVWQHWEQLWNTQSVINPKMPRSAKNWFGKTPVVDRMWLSVRRGRPIEWFALVGNQKYVNNIERGNLRNGGYLNGNQKCAILRLWKMVIW